MSLLNADAKADDTPPANTDTPAAGSNWFWDEGIPGTGARPSFLPEKYKTVAEVAKAQRELETRLGSAPPDYDFTKASDFIPSDSPHLKKISDHAKQRHVPQDVIDVVMEGVGDHLRSVRPNKEVELSKLGAEAEKRLELLSNWAKSNLSEKAFKTLTTSSALNTAEMVEALEEIRSKSLSSITNVPNGNETGLNGSYGVSDYRAEISANYERYKSDPTFRSQLDTKFERAMANKK